MNLNFAIAALLCSSLLAHAPLLMAAPKKNAGTTSSGMQALRAEKMKNGMELIAFESHKVPLVTIVLAVKAGAMTETLDINGLTHLWEHMFFKGNARLPNQEAFNRRIRQLGIVYNGDTSAEKVRYYFTLPSIYLDEGLQFMADAISTPLLERAELERERRVVLDEYDRNASNPGFDLWKMTQGIIYDDKAFHRDALGVRKTIETATRDQLLRIKAEVFVPANSALLVAGDFDGSKLAAMVEKHFAAWSQPADWKPMGQNDFPEFPKKAEIVMTRAMAQNVDFDIIYAGPKVRIDPKDTYAVDVLSSMLALPTGKFYTKFIDSGLCLAASAGYGTQWQAGEINISAATTPENAVKARQALLEEIPLWAKPNYFDAQQLENVRRSLLVSHKMDLNQPSAFIKNIAFWWAVTGLDYYNDYLKNLRAISLSDITKFVQKYLIDKPYVTTTLLSPEAAKIAGLADNSAEWKHFLPKK